METISSIFSTLKTPAGELSLRYDLTAWQDDRGRKHFGVAVFDDQGGRAAVENLTCSRARAERFFHRVIRGQVTTVSLRETAEDFVAEP